MPNIICLILLILLHYTNLNHRELENARSEITVAFERAKVLEERLKEQAERLIMMAKVSIFQHN